MGRLTRGVEDYLNVFQGSATTTVTKSQLTLGNPPHPLAQVILEVRTRLDFLEFPSFFRRSTTLRWLHPVGWGVVPRVSWDSCVYRSPILGCDTILPQNMLWLFPKRISWVDQDPKIVSWILGNRAPPSQRPHPFSLWVGLSGGFSAIPDRKSIFVYVK